MVNKTWAKYICFFIPPILSHRVQNKLYPTAFFQKEAIDFLASSITGGILHGNSKDFLAAQFFFHGYFEWRNIVLVKSILKLNKGNVIEVGANIGTETISYTNLCKNNIYGFEPDSENFNSLKELKLRNKISNLEIFNLGVSDKMERLEFKKANNYNSGTGYFLRKSTGTIELVNLDTFLLAKIKSCSVIVIDVEGFELKVLRGAKELIKKFQPYIILEVNSKLLESRANHNSKDIMAFFHETNYVFRRISAVILDGRSLQNLQKTPHVNWIAVPEKKRSILRHLSFKLTLNAFNPFFKKIIL